MRVEVTIHRGHVKMDVVDGLGPSCEEVTKSYVNRLAEGPVEQAFKPEHSAGDERQSISEFGG